MTDAADGSRPDRPTEKTKPSWPVFTSLAGYQSSWLSCDFIAALTVWAVLVPEALAYASIAGVSPVVGLYAAPAALIFYAAFGSSKHLVVGPMAATAALSAAATADIAAHSSADVVQLTMAIAIVTGVCGLVAGLLRLGFLASFISEPVLKGFIIGLSLTIIVGQLPHIFGVPGGEGDFFEKLWDLIGNLDETQGWTLLVGTVSLAIVLGLRRFAPRVPASLVAVAAGIAAVPLFGLEGKGVEIVGSIQSGLPSLGLPDVSWSDYAAMASTGVGILLVGFGEGLAAAKTYAKKERYPIDANRELIGLGAANLGSGLSSGMVVAGSLSKTAVNGSAGARTQASGMFVAALTVVTLLFLTGLFENLPEATLAAVVIAAVIDLVDYRPLTRLYRLYTSELGRIYGVAARADLIAGMAALFGVLIFDTLPGLFIGIGVSVLLMVYRASRPHVALLGQEPGTEHWVDVERHVDAVSSNEIVVVRPEAELFYANADNVHAAISRHLTSETRVVVLDLESVPAIDVTATEMLVDLADDLKNSGVRLGIARETGQVGDLMRQAGAGQFVDTVYPSVEAALRALDGSP
jgi:sulfate permease, SulP family